MNVKDWLELVAYKSTRNFGIDDEPTPIYLSKFDDSYVTHVGLESDMEFFADKEITQELTYGVGFSPKENKWYGWSHRAIYGFTIGSTCKKGSCYYVPATPEELIEGYAGFYRDISEESYLQHKSECQTLDDRSGIRILPAPRKIPIVSNENELMDAIDGELILPEEDISGGPYIIKCGRGEWTAKTLDDAKQMAIDFNEGVS